MRFRRLTLEAGEASVSLPFHDRLTVVAGLGRLERETVIGELLGALAGSREGVEVEVEDDDGRILRIGRPEGEQGAAVVDVAAGKDVSEEFLGASGQVDLLGACGLDPVTARQLTRLSAADVAASSHSESMVVSLARLEQAQLWLAAERLRDAGERLEQEASAAGSTIEDAGIIEEIEDRHHAFEAAVERQGRVREHGLMVAGVCAVAAIPATVLQPLAALPFLAITILLTLISVVLRHRLDRARRAEERALAAAGARSYLGFHIQRVEGLWARGEMKDRLRRTADDHRVAQRAWWDLVGDVDLDWALARRGRIEAAARGLAAGEPDLDGSPLEPSDLAHAIVSRLTELRNGAAGRTLPLILDEPFAGADGSIKHWLLELIGTSAGNPQIVYLTEDEEVAAWARLEAMTGDLAVIEPAAGEDPGEGDDDTENGGDQATKREAREAQAGAA